MSEATGWLNRFKIVVLIALSLGLTCFGITGCVGYADGGYGEGYGDYGGSNDYDDGGPGVYIFGDGYGRGRDAQYYSHRGAGSRGVAHSGGRGFGGHGGGGGGHGGGGGRH